MRAVIPWWWRFGWPEIWLAALWATAMMEVWFFITGQGILVFACLLVALGFSFLFFRSWLVRRDRALSRRPW